MDEHAYGCSGVFHAEFDVVHAAAASQGDWATGRPRRCHRVPHRHHPGHVATSRQRLTRRWAERPHVL